MAGLPEHNSRNGPGHNLPGIASQFATHNPGFATHNPGFATHNPGFATQNPSFATQNPGFPTYYCYASKKMCEACMLRSRVNMQVLRRVVDIATQEM